MNERHPVEHLSWAASACLFLVVGWFFWESVSHLPQWAFIVSGLIIALSLCVSLPLFLAIHLSAIHKVQHTDVPKQIASKPRAPRRSPVQLDKTGGA